jgi:hypothetical protein
MNSMRAGFVHVAVLDVDGDPSAPGAAITALVCGDVDHPTPCPIAPHHTGLHVAGGHIHLRVLFATEPRHETLVRDLIERALRTGVFPARNGDTVHWRLLEHHPDRIQPHDHALAERLIHAPTAL